MHFSIGIRAYAHDIRFNHLGLRSSIANLDLRLHTYSLTLMDHLVPPMFDVSNIDIWKLRMSVYLKIGLNVYLTTTKKTYFGNAKYIEANAQILDALKYSLSKDYLSMVSHCDSAFAVWNTLTSPELQTTNLWRKNLVEMSLMMLAT